MSASEATACSSTRPEVSTWPLALRHCQKMLVAPAIQRLARSRSTAWLPGTTTLRLETSRDKILESKPPGLKTPSSVMRLAQEQPPARLTKRQRSVPTPPYLRVSPWLD